MAVGEKWYFTKEQLLQSPSRKSGYDVDKELSCRQQAANFIQDMGQRLQVSQLCINTAIVYMHRFYVFHSLAAFHRNAIAAAALFLAAKVEEQPRKLEHVIKVAHMCLHRENPNLDTKSEIYLEQAQDLVFNENVLLQTLGFDVAIDHPHTHVVRCCQLVRASKDLAQTSYFMASNSLHLTTMCLQYKPTVVACFCIHLACKWSNWEIPRSNEGKDWFWYIDKTVTIDLLEQLTAEFLAILDKCPTKLKRKMMSMNQNNAPGFTQQTVAHDGLQFDEPRKLTGSEANKPPEGLFPLQKSSSQSSSDKGGTSSSGPPLGHTHHQKIDYREYREKKERERIGREKQQRDGHNTSASNHHHHSKSNIMPNKSHGQSRSSSGSVSHKSYQQPPHHGMQQNMHFQNMKDGRESNSQSFQSSTSAKDSNYLKQHPPHTDRESSKDGVTFHGQYSQNSNLQHQGYPHKSDSNYGGSYPHRESNRGSHGVAGSGSSNLPQSHHNQNQNQINAGSSSNPANSQKEYLMGNQRESVGGKDSESQSQPIGKDPMSSSIRDIIGQAVTQKDPHSMASERKEHMREKSRMSYMHGSSSSVPYRSESVKSGREQIGLNFNDSTDRKMEDFSSKLKKKGEEDSAIDNMKQEPLRVKNEKFDETDLGDENGTWNLSNVKTEKSNVPVTIKTEQNSGKNEISIESNMLDSYGSNSDASKLQSVHSAKMFDPKYKTHHYHSSSKNSEVPQVKIEKPGAQCSSDVHKKISDRNHDKHRKIQELERIPHGAEGNGTMGDASKHHKINKEMSDKNKMLLTGQQGDQRLKEKMSPSLYQKMKSAPRPGSIGYMKPEAGHFNLDSNPNSNATVTDRNETFNQSLKSLRPVGADDSSKSTNAFPKQKPHEFGNAVGQQSLQDANAVKSNKTSSIFSPDSKIPPQNILSSLEKDSKKNNSSAHRGHSSNKTPPNSTISSKKSMPVTGLSTLTTSTTSTTGSLFSPPLPKNVPSIPPRHRTPSSGSEPELIPVLTKLEETPGYENIIRERKIALSHTNEVLPGGVEKEKKMSIPSEKNESSSTFLFGSEHKVNYKDGRTSDIKTNVVKSDVMTQPVTSKSVSGGKFPNEIRSDLGAVIYPTNPKTVPVSKSSQGFSSESVSTVNLLGIEKMVDTSISPAKSAGQFPAASLKSNSAHFNTSTANSFPNQFCSSSGTLSVDQTDKIIVDQIPAKANAVPNQEMISGDILGYSDKKRSEKKKKKEKHKHKEKDKDKSERKKEKKKHKAKDKERSREREKSKDKEKHRDKEKHKEKEIDVVSSETPIKITIPKDKISGSLKFKISKDCLKKEEPDALKSNTSGELKIKISKDVISSIGGYREESKSDSKKRERSPKSSSDLPHSKSMKTSEKKSSSSSLKSNGTEGPSRNSSSHRYSVSENGSCFDISSLYDFPFDFEENGHGIIKTPDYDFEALNVTEFLQEGNTSPEIKEPKDSYKNSHNESDATKDDCVATSEPEADAISKPDDERCDVDVSCGDITTDDIILKPISPILDVESPKRSRKGGQESTPTNLTSKPTSPLDRTHTESKRDGPTNKMNSIDVKKGQTISLENCDVLKNYKTILDSHSKRCQADGVNRRSVSPVSPEEMATDAICNINNDDNNNKNTSSPTEPVVGKVKTPVKTNKSTTETENPNYYNKYFKKDGGTRIRTREDKRTGKGRPDEGGRFDDKQRYYDVRRYRGDYNERERREDRRFYKDYRDYSKDSQYYFERKDERRYEYQGFTSNQFFNASKPEGGMSNLNYEMGSTGAPTVYQACPTQTKVPPQFPQVCDPSMPANPDMNVQYQYGYFNNYLYPNGIYRFYGNVPYMNMSLIQQQQPMPPGTGDSFVSTVQPPPLPLEPPPDLPPPPETPPPPPK
ncbi:hypothetical protein RUM44_006624 [Polyplax serrata]|uniref:Cyclin-like domain-containing protein n=1 Tax=Polyplax serrata TaxID=468196 RepID=A0ABR1AIP1_POLSC